MEQHLYNPTNFMEPTVHQQFDHPDRNERWPLIPVEIRLKENKERRLIIQKQKQRQNQYILEKRKQKQDNVQRILKEKQQARQNAKILLTNLQKTFSNRFQEGYIKKNDDIEEKIQQCRQDNRQLRTRADQYKTMYKKKIHQERMSRERSVRDRRFIKDQEIKDKSLNHHLAEWRNYEKKIAEKYRGSERNPNRIYQTYTKKQQDLQKLLQNPPHQNPPQHSDHNSNQIQSHPSAMGTSHQKQQNQNPIYSIHDISSFGLSKSIKNPQRIIKEMKQFIENTKIMEDVIKDEELIYKFQGFLDDYGKLGANC